MNTRLVFAADLVPTASNEEKLIHGEMEYLFGRRMLDYLAAADFRCFNLETNLTDLKSHARYPGPYLCAAPETIVGIRKLQPSLLTLGNNHALDQGEEGLSQTMQCLQEAGISYTGAGKSIEEAARPFFCTLNNLTFGVFNCTEYEFAAAAGNHGGANPYDPLTSFDIVRTMSERCDVAIVLFHGGKELYRYPSPDLQRICRKFAECGAKLVICQHSHCIGCEEKYQQCTILYGQGNFLFDGDYHYREERDTGLFVELRVEAAGRISVSYQPFIKQGECVRLADEKQSEMILQAFSERSRKILLPGFIEAEYEKLANAAFERYVRTILGGRRWQRILNKISGGKYFRHYYDDRQALAVLNVISPENHSELFRAGLRNHAGNRGKEHE